MESEKNNSQELLRQIKEQQGLIVYFYSDNCAPCVSLRPKVSALVAEDFPKMKLLLINSQEYPDVTGSYGVFANPTLIVFFEGKEFRRYSKYISINELGGDIERVYKMVFE